MKRSGWFWNTLCALMMCALVAAPLPSLAWQCPHTGEIVAVSKNDAAASASKSPVSSTEARPQCAGCPKPTGIPLCADGAISPCCRMVLLPDSATPVLRASFEDAPLATALSVFQRPRVGTIVCVTRIEEAPIKRSRGAPLRYAPRGPPVEV